MMNKKDIKTAKKIIKFKNMSEWVFHLDKYTKVGRFKIKNMDIIEETEGYKMYKVKYKMGANLFNPLTWIILIIPKLLIIIIEALKDLWATIKTYDYTTTLKIKK